MGEISLCPSQHRGEAGGLGLNHVLFSSGFLYRRAGLLERCLGQQVNKFLGGDTTDSSFGSGGPQTPEVWQLGVSWEPSHLPGFVLPSPGISFCRQGTMELRLDPVWLVLGSLVHCLSLSRPNVSPA